MAYPASGRGLPRRLLTVAISLVGFAANAESGPPTPDELSRAGADCAAAVTQNCLMILSVEAALASDSASYLLNEIAFAQAVSGNIAEAERTLSLTTPGPLALMALGRDAEADVAWKDFANSIGATTTNAESPNPDEVALDRIKRLIGIGNTDAALSTALEIPDKYRVTQAIALRLIVDYHLERRNFVAALQVARQMNSSFDELSASLSLTLGGRYVDQHGDALAAIVRAQAAAGDLPGAAAVVTGIIKPQARITARIELAAAYFKATKIAEARTQLDQILLEIQQLEPSPYFGLVELTRSADLAFLNGETPIARKFADLAYKTYTRPTVRRGGERGPPAPSRTDLVNLAVVLQLVGQVDKGRTLMSRAVKPYGDSLLGTAAAEQSAAVLVALVRLGDHNATTMIDDLLAKEEPFWSNGRHALHRAALDLAKLGFTVEALAIADALELRLRDDLLHLDGNDPAELYTAILVKDPSLASQVLTGKLSARTHFAVALGLARSLHAAGDDTKAQTVLQNLFSDHKDREPTDAQDDYETSCALRAIAFTQAVLGYNDDAALSRSTGLARANRQTDPAARSLELLILAASFPDHETASLTQTFLCLRYP